MLTRHISRFRGEQAPGDFGTCRCGLVGGDAPAFGIQLQFGQLIAIHLRIERGARLTAIGPAPQRYDHQRDGSDRNAEEDKPDHHDRPNVNSPLLYP